MDSHQRAEFDSLLPRTIHNRRGFIVTSLGAGFALVCPSTPSANMTTYMGHLFDKAALSGGPDANLVRALSQQTDGTVGLVRHAVVRFGTDAIRAAAWALKDQGRRFAIVDALDEGDVVATAAAALGQPLVCGTESLAEALAARMPAQSCPLPPTPPGAAAVIAMSSSRATLFQVGQARATLATLDLDPVATPDARALAAAATAWAAGKLGPAPVMIAMTLMPDQALRLTRAIGAVAAATLMRDTAALVAKHLADHGVRRLLLAGMAADGEVVRSLGVRQMRVVAEIDRGVPWTHATGDAADMMVGIKPDDAGGRGVLAGAFELLG